MEVILDTNILIEILKNNKHTIQEVEKYNFHYISVISAMELFYGALNKNELKKLNNFVNLFDIIQLDNDISQRAKNLVYKYSKSHKLDIPDSLIASTSLSKDIPLLTYNKKDFVFIENLILY